MTSPEWAAVSGYVELIRTALKDGAEKYPCAGSNGKSFSGLRLRPMLSCSWLLGVLVIANVDCKCKILKHRAIRALSVQAVAHRLSNVDKLECE